MKESIDFLKIRNYAVINLNNMFPVPKGLCYYVDINSQSNPKYKSLLLAEYRVIKSIQEKITEERLSLRLGEVYDVLVEEIVAPSEQSDSGLAIGRTWFEAPEVDGNIVIRYELDDKRAVNSIVPGKFVRVKALSVSGVDIDGIFVGE